jgi:hypothetical protein
MLALVALVALVAGVAVPPLQARESVAVAVAVVAAASRLERWSLASGPSLVRGVR